MLPLGDHEFGSQDTDLKLSIVEHYLQSFTTALRRSFKELWYIDAFAGTGQRTVRVEARDGGLFDEPASETVEQRRGSAQIAIDISPQFDRLIFVEKSPRYCAALRALKENYANRNIEIVEDDANAAIRSKILNSNPSNVRAVMFLDPYGMDVEWDTLKAIAKSGFIDLWYLFSLSGLYRQAARRAEDIDAPKRAAITRMLGTDRWENELYSPSPQPYLFDNIESHQRHANVAGLERYVRERLRTIFPCVLQPLPLPVERRPQLFSLFFAISNPNPKAIGLATRIANHILASGKSSQVRPR